MRVEVVRIVADLISFVAVEDVLVPQAIAVVVASSAPGAVTARKAGAVSLVVRLTQPVAPQMIQTFGHVYPSVLMKTAMANARPVLQASTAALMRPVHRATDVARSSKPVIPLAVVSEDTAPVL